MRSRRLRASLSLVLPLVASCATNTEALLDSGLAPIDDVTTVTDMGALPPGPGTLAAWLEEQIGQTPAGGQTLRHNGADILVRRVRRGRVFEASVTTTGVGGGAGG
jgi:hypothetical protein